MKTRMLAILAISVMVTVLATGQTATLNKNSELRSLPAATSRAKSKLPSRTTVMLLGRTKRNGFYHVRTDAGLIGWTPVSALTLEAATTEAHTSVGASNATLSASRHPFSNQLSGDDRAHSLLPQASQGHTNQCSAGIKTFQDCHNSYAEGCTTSSKPNTYDAYLSYLKNLLPSPASAKAELVSTFKSLDDFAKKEKELQQLGIGKQGQAEFGQELADLSEGNIYALAGYLYYAIPGGNETCNCKLTNPNDKDYHIGIGFDPEMAAEIANGTITLKQSEKEPDPIEKAAVVVEMTPHYRAKYHTNWTLSRLQQLFGKQVKVIGQLLVDNEHNVKGQNCAIDPAHSATDLCWRASVWELHPVTDFYVCTTTELCQADSEEGWVELDDLTEH